MLTEAGNYRLRIPQRALQSLAGARIDLRVAEDMIQHCIDTDDEIHEMCDELEEACWTAALTRYKRAFSQASWAADEVVISNLTYEQFESHFFFLFLRDRLFSHSLGFGEDFEITAAVFPQGGARLGIVGVGPRPRRISSPGADLAKDFLDLLNVVRSLVEPHYEHRRATLLHELSLLPLGDVAKGKPVNQQAFTLTKDDPIFRRFFKEAAERRNTLGK